MGYDAIGWPFTVVSELALSPIIGRLGDSPNIASIFDPGCRTSENLNYILLKKIDYLVHRFLA
jgi:hypothetical protein